MCLNTLQMNYLLKPVCIILFLACIQLKADIGIITPSTDTILSTIETKRIKNCNEGLKKLLAKQGFKSVTIPSNKLIEHKLTPNKLKSILIIGLESWDKPTWQKVHNYIKKGGSILWQGVKIRRKPYNDYDIKQFEALTGANYGTYTSDPMLGKGTINSMMWIKTIIPKKQQYNVFKDNKDQYFHVFAGESFKLTNKKGVVTGDWYTRDKQIAEGPAIISNIYGKGKTICFSNYLLYTAIRPESSHVVNTAQKMLTDSLKWLTGKSKATKPKKRAVGPINWQTIQPQEKCPRAMWIWGTNWALRPKDGDDLLKFCQQRAINELYLYISSASFRDKIRKKQLGDFIQKANTAGIKVHALDGWPEALLPENHDKFLDVLKLAIAFNKSMPKEKQLAGFQSDVEPGCLKGSHNTLESRKRVDKHFIELHQKCQNLIASSGLNNFSFGLAISEQYDREDKEKYVNWNGKLGNVCDHMADIVDYFAIMSYHDLADETINQSAYEVNKMKEKGKKAWVGFETLNVAYEYDLPDTITFHEEGLDEMENHITQTAKHFKNNPGFGGIAIHCYRSYRSLQKEPLTKQNGPSPTQTITYISTPPQIDGLPKEWHMIPPIKLNTSKQVVFGKENWAGPNDLSATIKYAYDNNNFYLFADVKDDKLFTEHTKSDIWKDDHVELWLSGPERGKSFQFGFRPNNDTNQQEAYTWYPLYLNDSDRKEKTKQLQFKTLKTKNGYQLEAAIPWQLIIADDNIGKTSNISAACAIGDTDSKEKIHKTLLSDATQLKRNRPKSFCKLIFKKKN